MENDDIKNMEQSILEAAEKLFLDKGFSMTSTTEIAREAGCNQALVHYYYRTKDKLFEAIFERKFRKFVEPFLNTIQSDLPFEKHLIYLIESHFDLIKENPKVPFLLFNELWINPSRLEPLRMKLALEHQAYFEKLDKELQKEIKKGNYRNISIIDLMMTIFSLNVTLFLAGQILQEMTKMDEDTYNAFLLHRKKENVLIVLKSLQA